MISAKQHIHKIYLLLYVIVNISVVTTYTKVAPISKFKCYNRDIYYIFDNFHNFAFIQLVPFLQHQ